MIPFIAFRHIFRTVVACMKGFAPAIPPVQHAHLAQCTSEEGNIRVVMPLVPRNLSAAHIAGRHGDTGFVLIDAPDGQNADRMAWNRACCLGALWTIVS